MKKHLVLLSALLLQAAAVSVFAQDKPKAGDLITGVVTGGNVPITMVHIMELDSVHDYYVTDTRTDSTGRFSLRLVKPGDRLCIHKEGFETVIIPITNFYYKIKLQAQQQTVDLSEFDGLEQTIYDYVLQGPRPSETTTVSAFAQDKPKAGDMILGIVRNSDGPMACVNIEEIDFYDEHHDSVCSKAVTDENGEFSFRLVNPENQVLISCKDYESVWINDFTQSYYEISLKPAAPIQPIKILDGPNEITTLPAVVSDEKLPLPVAGSTVTGYVKSDEGPLERACVIEIAGIDSLVDFYYTDENGFFSFEIADPNDSLMISYIGHETIKVAIDRTEYDIILKGRKDMTTVDVDADRKIVLY